MTGSGAASAGGLASGRDRRRVVGFLRAEAKVLPLETGPKNTPNRMSACPPGHHREVIGWVLLVTDTAIVVLLSLELAATLLLLGAQVIAEYEHMETRAHGMLPVPQRTEGVWRSRHDTPAARLCVGLGSSRREP